MSRVLGHDIPCSPTILLLNDFTGLNLSMLHQRWFLVAITAAKRMVAQRWLPPHTLYRQQWVNAAIDLANLEMSVAHMHGARKQNISLWTSFIEAVSAGSA